MLNTLLLRDPPFPPLKSLDRNHQQLLQTFYTALAVTLGILALSSLLDQFQSNPMHFIQTFFEEQFLLGGVCLMISSILPRTPHSYPLDLYVDMLSVLSQGTISGFLHQLEKGPKGVILNTSLAKSLAQLDPKLPELGYAALGSAFYASHSIFQRSLCVLVAANECSASFRLRTQPKDWSTRADSQDLEKAYELSVKMQMVPTLAQIQALRPRG